MFVGWTIYALLRRASRHGSRLLPPEPDSPSDNYHWPGLPHQRLHRLSIKGVPADRA
jgi:hypothetical protein